jgi:hypothetical protein
MYGLIRASDRQTGQFRFDMKDRQGAISRFAIGTNLVAILVRLETGKWLIELYDTSTLDQE